MPGRFVAALRRREGRPAFVVHDRAGAERVLAAAAGKPVVLLTAPGAAAYAGPRLLAALARLVPVPEGSCWMIDCGDAPGDVLAAVAHGWRDIAFTPAGRGGGRARAALAVLVRAGGGRLHTRPPRPLDLAAIDPGHPALRGMLSAHIASRGGGLVGNGAAPRIPRRRHADARSGARKDPR